MTAVLAQASACRAVPARIGRLDDVGGGRAAGPRVDEMVAGQAVPAEPAMDAGPGGREAEPGRRAFGAGRRGPARRGRGRPVAGPRSRPPIDRPVRGGSRCRRPRRPRPSAGPPAGRAPGRRASPWRRRRDRSAAPSADGRSPPAAGGRTTSHATREMTRGRGPAREWTVLRISARRLGREALIEKGDVDDPDGQPLGLAAPVEDGREGRADGHDRARIGVERRQVGTSIEPGQAIGPGRDPRQDALGGVGRRELTRRIGTKVDADRATHQGAGHGDDQGLHGQGHGLAPD